MDMTWWQHGSLILLFGVLLLLSGVLSAVLLTLLRAGGRGGRHRKAGRGASRCARRTPGGAPLRSDRRGRPYRGGGYISDQVVGPSMKWSSYSFTRVWALGAQPPAGSVQENLGENAGKNAPVNRLENVPDGPAENVPERELENVCREVMENLPGDLARRWAENVRRRRGEGSS